MAHGKWNQESEEEKISKINSAGIINITLENLWKDSYNCAASGDFLKWNRKLDSIWMILGGENKSPEKEFNDLDLSLHKLGSLSPNKAGFNNLPDDYQKIRNQQYLKLRDKALFLRKLQNSQGKGTAYAKDDDDDLM